MTEETIFQAALDREDPADRADYLDEACTGNAALRERVEALLRSHDDPDFLVVPALRRQADTNEAAAADDFLAFLAPGGEPGSLGRLDHYEVLEVIGKGGMGVVYKARDLQLNRLVALKMIRASLQDDAEQLQRFLTEAEAVAQLQHANIVPIFEIGRCKGLPYFTLEWVPGGSLAHKLKAGPLPAATAARLLEQVAQGIQAAHQRGIVHRDLKPDNVLLAEDGTPRVADFGLAKRVEVDDGGTVTGVVLGTPSYMAPEQAGGKNRQVGPASDVYALGTILYEMLTGRPPFKAATVLDTLLQVRNDEPAAPSLLQSKVPRDLETICLKCLRKEPEKRYLSAAALAEDLQRFQRGEPIQARPVGRVERTWRWGRQHPAQAGLVAAGVLALVLGTAAVVYRQQQRQHGREQARTGLIRVVELRERYRFKDAEAMLEQVRGWVRQAADRDWDTRLEQAVADLALARDLDDVTQKGATRVEGMWNAAWVRAEYQDVFARHRFDVLAGDIDELARSIRDSAVRENIVAALDDLARAETDPQRKQRLLRLANRADEPDSWRQAVRQAVAEKDGGRLRQLVRRSAEGKPTPQVILLLADALGPKSDEPTALLRHMQMERPSDFWVSIALGGHLAQQGRYQEAAECALVTVALRPDSAPAHYNLGLARHHTGKEDEAIAWYQKAIALDPGYAQAHVNLGLALDARGKVQEAIASYKRAIALDPRLAQAHNNLGTALQGKGQVEEAIACYQKAITLDPKLAIAHAALGNALLAKGQHDEAIACYRQALALDPKFAPAHNNLGNALTAKGKVDEAIACYHKAIALDPKNAAAHSNLGFGLKDKGKAEEAIACFKRAIDLTPEFARAHAGLGIALADNGKVDAAIACYRKAIALDPKLAQAHSSLGIALYGKGKVDEAIACYQKAIDLDPKNARLHHNLGIALKGKGQVDEAMACYRKAISLDPKFAQTHYSLGVALYGKGKVDEAIACWRTARDLDPTHAKTHNNLGFALFGKGQVDEAIACYQRAIALDPKLVQAHSNLGFLLMQQGNFLEAQKVLDRCLALVRPGHPLRDLTSRQLRQCQHLLDIDGKLNAFLSGKGAPADAVAQVQMALVAQQPYRRHYLTAARLYRDALARQPRLAARYRYGAACASALAGTRQGKDRVLLNDRERARWRQQAHDWLRAELARWDKVLDKANAQARAGIVQSLRHWQSNPDLAVVRDRAALDNFPEAERKQWLALWTDVAALLERAVAAR
jgi:serine/threonine-protein kinase